MDKEQLIKEKKQLEEVKRSLNTIKSQLSNLDINDKLSKVLYILSNDFLVDDKNNKLKDVQSVMTSRNSRIGVCNEIINSINVRIRSISNKIDSLDSI